MYKFEIQILVQAVDILLNRFLKVIILFVAIRQRGHNFKTSK